LEHPEKDDHYHMAQVYTLLTGWSGFRFLKPKKCAQQTHYKVTVNLLGGKMSFDDGYSPRYVFFSECTCIHKSVDQTKIETAHKSNRFGQILVLRKSGTVKLWFRMNKLNTGINELNVDTKPPILSDE
jgi:hypothetical protein